MKIGFVYESSFATNNGSNHLLEATIKKILGDGHDVFLFQSSYLDKIENEVPLDFLNENFHYIPIKLKQADKKKFLRRYINGIIFSFKFRRKIKNIILDLYFIQSSPTVSFSILAAHKKNVPIIYNIHDVFPGSAYDLGIIKSRILNTILKNAQKIGYNRAEKIIVVSDDMKNKLIDEKVNKRKIEVVNTWFDSDNIRYINNEENSFIKEFNIDTSKLILQYAGNVGQVFGIKDFVKLTNMLKDEDKIEFHIIGSGVKLDLLIALTKDCNIKFYNWQNQNRLKEIYSYPDFEIIPLHKGVIGNNVPSKMALAMACGKPIINIVEESNYYNLFENNEIGLSFKHDEIEDLAIFLRKYVEDKSGINFDSQKIVNFNENMFSMKKNTDKIMNIIYNILKGENQNA